MTIIESLQGLSSAVEVGARLVGQLQELWKSLIQVAHSRPVVAYENLLLELVYDIQDRHGIRAVLDRRQRVRFLAEDSEIVRELVWGDGEQLARYSVRGARRMLIRPEGSKRAVLLGLPNRPSKGDLATLRSRRVIRGGFRESTEYCETWLERPTRRVVMTVIFPVGRPPHAAQLVTAPEVQTPRTVPIRFAADGRAYVRWSVTRPALDLTYSLRWSW